MANGTDPNTGVGYAQVSASAATPLTNYQTVALGNASAPFAVAVHPAGGLLYAVDNNAFSLLHVFTIDATTGVPTETAASIAAPTPAGSGGLNHIAIDPYGRFIYVTDDLGNTIYGFTIDQTNTANPGALTNIAGTGALTSANLSVPEDMVIDPTGTYLYVTNSGADNVSAYQINQSTGALTALATPTEPTGSTPYFETFDPSGKHLFVANSLDSTVSVFTIGAGGALGTAASVTTAAGSVANVAIAPSGNYIYVWMKERRGMVPCMPTRCRERRLARHRSTRWQPAQGLPR